MTSPSASQSAPSSALQPEPRPAGQTLRPYHVLFLGGANAARSIMAEAILNLTGRGARFLGFSAGIAPGGGVHPETVSLLTGLGYDHSALRSKSWEEFAAPSAPPVDFLVGVGEASVAPPLPAFFGAPLLAHWPTADPNVPVGGDSPATSHARAYWLLEQRVKRLLALPAAHERDALAAGIAAIGRLPLARRG